MLGEAWVDGLGLGHVEVSGLQRRSMGIAGPRALFALKSSVDLSVLEKWGE